MSNATVVRKLELVPKKAAPAGKKEKLKGPPLCTHSGRGYNDINHSERSNGQYACGDCGTRFTFSPEEVKEGALVVPKHQIPEEVHAYRKVLERNSKG